MADPLDALCAQYGRLGVDGDVVRLIYFECDGSLSAAHSLLQEMAASSSSLSSVSSPSVPSTKSSKKHAKKQKLGFQQLHRQTLPPSSSASASSSFSFASLCTQFPFLETEVLEDVLQNCGGSLASARDACETLMSQFPEGFAGTDDQMQLISELLAAEEQEYEHGRMMTASDEAIARFLQESEHAAAVEASAGRNPLRLSAWNDAGRNDDLVQGLRQPQSSTLMPSDRAGRTSHWQRDVSAIRQETERAAMDQSGAARPYVSTQSRSVQEELHACASARGSYYQLALMAYGAGEGCKAKEYARKGREYDERCTQLQEEAKRAACDALRKSLLRAPAELVQVDLHGFHVVHACDLVERVMQIAGGRKVRFVTGRGTHSANGRCRILPAVLALCGRKGWRASRPQDGCVDVSL